ncbi:MAG: trypsin-like peptidase domain-containing protein [Sandaracinaceae bacterium]|nr:trypsin-like peptidase domain-containing protein [Sandaracinaceae bacterium]
MRLVHPPSRALGGLWFAALLLGSASVSGSAPAAGQAPVAPTPPPPADGGIESRIRLRPIDRASVRVLQITGASAYTFEGRVSRVRRAVSLPDAVHGTGVVVGPEGLVLTAAHVVRGGDVLAILRPGADEPQAARVIYSDAEHDLAVLAVDGPLPDRITLPTAIRPLTLSERLFATGYPLDIRERYPAAVSGELSRENNDGSLQVGHERQPRQLGRSGHRRRWRAGRHHGPPRRAHARRRGHRHAGAAALRAARHGARPRGARSTPAHLRAARAPHRAGHGGLRAHHR